MMMESDEKDLAARNAASVKLAIFLGLVAFGFYAGFILMYYFN